MHGGDIIGPVVFNLGPIIHIHNKMQLRFILIGILFENAEPIKSCVICIRFYSEIDPYNLKDQGERVGTTLYFRISPKKA